MKPHSLMLALAGASAACAQTNLEFKTIERLTNGEVRLQLSAPTGQAWRLEVSSNLAQWHGFVSVLSTGSLQHTDSATPYLSTRFYRGERVNPTNLVTGDHLATAEGDVVIHPINHATFVLRWNGKMIYNDPVGSASLYQGLPKADLILLTHGHGDHFSAGTIDTVRGANAVIVAPPSVYSSLTSAQKALAKVLANGASTNLLGIPIAAIAAYNFTAPNHPKGVGNGYVLTLGGKRLYISGDAEDIPEMLALQNIDVAFLAMNVPYTMTLAQAVNAIRTFQPKIVYPVHYRNQNGTFTDLNALKRQVGTDLGLEVRLRAWY